MKYDAFISYSHAADDRLAPALQRALHAFARPWYRRRQLHVFRDQTSLSASPELWPAIEAALGDARFLLLMASPEAAASRWVGREISWWLEHRSAATMLIVVTAGEITWDEMAGNFDWTGTTCLPRSPLDGRLTAEPLWVDLRWAHGEQKLDLHLPRFRQAVLDLAAPLHGKDKDDLDGEDVQRAARTRWTVQGVVVVLIAALAMTLLQREEARRQATIATLGRLTAHADLMRERGGAADAPVMLAAEVLARLEQLDESTFEADLSLRRSLALLPHTLGEFDLGSRSNTIAANGRLLISRDPSVDSVIAFALPAGERRGCSIGSLPAGTPWGLVVAISGNGDRCILESRHGSDASTLRLASATPHGVLRQWNEAARGGRLRFALNESGTILAITAPVHSHDPQRSFMRLLDVAGDREILTSEAMEFRGFSPDGRRFATTAGLWELPADGVGQPRLTMAWKAIPQDIVFSPGGERLAIRTTTAGPIEIWPPIRDPETIPPRPPAGTLLAVSDDGRAVVVATSRDTLLWDMKFDHERARLPQRTDAASTNGRDLVALVDDVGPDGVHRSRLVTLPDLGAAAVIAELPDVIDPQWVEAVDGTDGRLRIVVRRYDQQRALAWDGSRGLWEPDASAEARAPPSSKPASWTGRARKSDTDAERRASTLIAGPRVDGDAPHVAILETPQRRIQFDHPTSVMKTATSDDGRFVATLDLNGTVRLHPTGPRELIALACARKPRPLPESLLRQMPSGNARGSVCDPR